MTLCRLLLKQRVGQALLLVGLTSTFLCLWIAQQEWEYHAKDRIAMSRLQRRLNGEHILSKFPEEVPGHAETNFDQGMQNAELNSEGYLGNETVNYKVIYKTRDKVEACPLYPLENLVGRLAGVKNTVTYEELAKLHPDVEMGGRVRPKNCKASEKVAIIIPFRNRHQHLNIVMNNLIPMLQRQMADARFFVIEQAMPTVFNRAALFNIGFLEAQKYDTFDCFIFHDVDLVPLNDYNLYRCDIHPMHFSTAMDRYNYSLPYKKYFGGVVGFTKEQYRKVNGNSNLYFGWGGEDDDLYERIENKHFEIARPYLDVGRYDMVRHKNDPGNFDNCDRRVLLKLARRRQGVEGLNTIKYKRKFAKVQSHMTLINVYIDMQEILQTAPDYVLREMKLMNSKANKNVCNFTRDSQIRK